MEINMKIIQTFLIFCSIAWTAQVFSSIEEPKKPQNIRILLKKNATEALLEVNGGYTVYDPYDGSKVSSGIFGKRYLIRPVQDGIKWGEVYPGTYQIKVTPDANTASILVDGIQYEGSIAIYKVGSSINIVNELPIESYLKATLSSQFAYPHEDEVMGSVAISARTTAYYHANKDLQAFWHLTKEEADYQGSALIIPDSPIVRAIDATRNIVLLQDVEGKKLPFTAVWTEHSAGKTAAYQSVFRKDALAPKTGVEAPHAALDRKDSAWNYTISKASLAKKMGIKNITSIELYVDQSSNKVYGLRVKDDQNGTDIDYFDLAKKLGKDNIKSNDFTVSVANNDVVFSGFGRGHGVGLCLYSAGAMAQNGQIASKILAKFFPDATLVNLSESKVK
jgi:stage II sporulation protein D